MTLRLGAFAVCAALLVYPQIQQEEARSLPSPQKTLRVAVGRGQPTFDLTSSIEGNVGKIVVREVGGPPWAMDTLTCRLSEVNYAPDVRPDPQFLEHPYFLEHLEAIDLDFDGNLDLRAPREFGGAWQRYCVWLY